MATLENLLSQAIVERLGWTLIHFVWQAAAIALLLAIVLKALHKHSASLRYIVACLALMLIVALPLVTMALVEVSEPVAEAGPAPAPMPIMEATPVEVIEVAELPAMPFDAPPLEMADVTVRVPWTQRAATALEPALPYLVLGWLLGVFGLSTWHLGGWAQLQRMKQRMVAEVASPLRTQLAALSEKLGVRRAAGLLESALVEVPTVVGWIKPVILLPASALSGLSPEQLEAILAHELAHVRRYDYLVNIAQTVVEILGFYHPAVWWISHKIRDERENCCDDLAVQVCGDSVRYARALTCLEEMRHRGTELAVAASGGSLVARIGRLLGRPAPTRSRFTWVPGLIALLLVAAIIPTALVLARPPQSQDHVATSPAPTFGKGSETLPEPKQILLEFIVAEILSDESLDRETAAGVGTLLAATPNGNLTLPSVDQLQQPLRQVLSNYLADPSLPGETVKAVTDLLISKGHARMLSEPHVLTLEGRQARIVIGDGPGHDISATSDRARDFRLSLDVTPTVQDNLNITSLRLELVIERAMRVFREGDRKESKESFERETSLGSMHFSIPKLAAANDRYTWLRYASVAERRDAQGQFHTPLLLVRPAVVEPTPDGEAIEPTAVHISLDPPDSATPSDSERTETTPGAAVKAQTQANAEEQNIPKILLDFTFANVLANKTLDPKTMLRIGALLGAEYPQVLNEITDAGSKEDMTLGAILQTWVVRKPLTPATGVALIELLESRGYLERESTPHVQTSNHRQSQINVTTEEPILPAEDSTSSPEYIELGTFVQATPHFSPEASDRITLEIAATWTERVGEAPAGELPTVTRTEIASTVTLPRDRFFAFLMEPDAAGNTPNADRQSKLVMFRADCVDPPAQQQSASVPPARQSDSHLRQVLLDVRTVVIEQSGLADLGIEWGSVPMAASPGSPKPLQGVSVGYTPDRTITDSLLTDVSRLGDQGRAQLLSRQQVVTLDGRQARVRAITEEWFSVHAPTTADQPEPQTERVSVASGTILSATPTINDNDEITLEIAVEYSDTIPQEAPALPVMARRTARNVVTVQDGGTVALAGVGTSNGAGNKQVVIFATASLAPEISAASRPSEASLTLPATQPTPGPAAMHAQESGRPAVTARREFISNDPMVRAMLQRIAQIEIDLVEAQQKFLPEHPETVEKKRMLESLNRRLAQRRQELEQQFDTGTLPTATPDTPAQQRANGERALEILREELARVEEEIRETRTAWYPEEKEAKRSRTLEELRQYKSVVERQCEEIARLLDEQIVANDGSQTEPSSSGPKEAEHVRFWHTDANGNTDRKFGFDELIDSEDGHWIVANAWMNLVAGDMRCRITADRAEVQLDPAPGQPFPSNTTFSGNVVVNITPSEPNGADACVLYVDELTYDAEKGCLSSSGPARSVCGGTEFIGRGLELSCGPAPTRPSGTPVKTIEGVDLYLGPANSFVVSLGAGQAERPESGESTQVRVLSEATDGRASSIDEQTQIMVDLELLSVPTDRALTPEAAARLADLWDQMVAKRETGGAGRASLPSAEALQIPPRELLERCAENGQGDSDALEIMTDLLASLEYVRVAMNPRVQVYNGKQATISSKQQVPDPTAEPGAPEMVECGTVVKVTPHADNAGRITLDVAAEITDLLPSNGAQEKPRIGKYSLNTKAVVDKDRTLVLRLEPTTEGEVQDSDIVYVLVRPRIVAVEPVPGTVMATFQGEDLRQALKEVAALAGANLMYDADLSGKVWATLQDVSLEKALEILLAGTPYVTRKTEYGYAITKREKPPARPASEKMNTLEVESRFVLVDSACMEALRGGLPIEGVTSPEDVNALHEIGAGLVEGKASLLEPAQADLLLKAIRRYAGSKMLAAPRVTVLDAESATMSLSEQLNYVGGYREPNEAAPEPIPQHESKTVGLTFEVTPHLLDNRNDIRLEFQTEISSLLDMQKAVYEGKYEYDVPSFETITVRTEVVMPDGQTALIYGGEVRSLDGTLPGQDRPAWPLLILIKPQKTIAAPVNANFPLMGGQGIGQGGMGAFRSAGSPKD